MMLFSKLPTRMAILLTILFGMGSGLLIMAAVADEEKSQPLTSTALSFNASFGVLAYLTRYGDNYAHPSGHDGTVAGSGSVPGAFPRPFRTFGGAACLGTLPDGPAHRTPQQKLR